MYILVINLKFKDNEVAEHYMNSIGICLHNMHNVKNIAFIVLCKQ